MDRNDWAHEFIDKIGAPHETSNARALISWMHAEGGNALWNPLNTTWKLPGSWNYNPTGVQNYLGLADGLHATALTIEQTNPNYGFAPILAHLRAGDSATATLRAVERSAWGTGGLALEVLPYVRADYWKYAQHAIAGS